jgi:hypothetical protein
VSSGARAGLSAIVTLSSRNNDSAASGAHSPLEQLLHALNQPLTGLQCSMEVALAGPRTVAYHVERLREGLKLTERMRALVEAMREVTDGETENTEPPESIELAAMLREGLDDLRPVAEMKNVRIMLDCPAAALLLVKVGRRRLSTLVFRVLESVLSLADRGSALRIETGSAGVAAEVVAGGGAEDAWVRIGWYAGPSVAEFSRPELGLLVAQAGWERMGAKWERERTENRETVTVRLPRILHGPSASSGYSQSSSSTEGSKTEDSKTGESK